MVSSVMDVFDDEKDDGKKKSGFSSLLKKSSKNNNSNSSNFEICNIIASSFDADSYEIADTLLNGRAVILDLSGVNKAVGQRLIDFTAGSVYAIDGSMQKISEFIFLICPADVGIVGDKREEDDPTDNLL
ncbi:MAG: cell division protein SepF [Lachnospiraceae bacterium]|nr:cell division protein SepF [Lachnospiraceae bacterium]